MGVISDLMKKKIVIFSILVSAIFNCIAQPNPGFELWHSEYSYQVPDDWQTLNFLTMFPPPNPLSASKATGIDKHSGNYALKIKTIFVSNNPAPNIISDTVGLAFTGKITLSPPAYKYGFPYTGRPEKLEFWAKYLPVGGDSAGARVVLLKWNGVTRDTIAFAEIPFGATISYTFFQFSLAYYSTAIPDSAAILFGSSKRQSQSRVGSTLFIDDVALTGWVGIDDRTKFSNKVKIFPNPARENVTIQTQIGDASIVKVSDVSGKQVGVYKIRNYSANINTGLFAEGVYFCEILDKKERIITKGKFNVVK